MGAISIFYLLETKHCRAEDEDSFLRKISWFIYKVYHVIVSC